MRSKRKETAIDYDKVFDIYNTDGKQAADEYVRNTYNIGFYLVARELKEESNYIYSRKSGTYILKSSAEEGLFMSLNQLCEKKKEPEAGLLAFGCPVSNLEEIVLGLIKDRFIELSKFVKMEQSSMTVTINAKHLQRAGYRVVIC